MKMAGQENSEQYRNLFARITHAAQSGTDVGE